MTSNFHYPHQIAESSHLHRYTNTSTNTSQGQIDKLENINNNHCGFGEKRVNNTISDNIYANVDPSNISYSSDPR